MKTRRNDVKRDKRLSKCLNSTLIGFSSYTLKHGDFFIFNEHYKDKTFRPRFAKCHGRIKPLNGGKWLILAQVASDNMTFDMERWIDTKDVTETIPAYRMNDHIKALFAEWERG